MPVATSDSGYIYHFFHALGVSASRAADLEALLDRPVKLVLLVALVLVAARYGGRVIRRTLGRVRSRVAVTDPGRASRIDTVARLTTSIWRIAIWTAGTFIALSVLGVNLTPFVAGATLIGATIGFGAQSLVRDFFSGLLMLAEDQYRIGDIVTINEVDGTVDEVSLRVTRLRDAEGTEWYIPNGQILKVGNRSRHWARLLLRIRIAPHADLTVASKVVLAAMHHAIERDDLRGTLISEPKVLGVSEIDVASTTVDVEIRTQLSAESAVRDLLTDAATRALERHGLQPGDVA